MKSTLKSSNNCFLQASVLTEWPVGDYQWCHVKGRAQGGLIQSGSEVASEATCAVSSTSARRFHREDVSDPSFPMFTFRMLHARSEWKSECVV